MRHKTLLIPLSLALFSVGVATAAAEVVVIAHNNIALAAHEVREVFLGEKQFAGAVRLMPVDNSPAQAEFLSKVLKLEVDRYSTAWTKKSFREGLNPPPLKSGDAEVLDYVRRTPGAVGYVSKAPTGVQIVQKY